MHRLVALALPPGPAFVDELTRIWDDGDAAFPIDLRLPPAAREGLLDLTQPAILVDERGRRSELEGSRPVEDGDALVVATSGTSGRPRAAVLTHEAVKASADATSTRLKVDPSVDRWLACLPLAHVGGLGVVLRALLTETPVEVLPGFDPAEVHRAAERGATLVSVVPTALRRMDPSCFRVVLVGGAAPPDGLPPNAVATYGMTETCGGVVYDGEPLEGVEVRVADDGEVLLRGPMLLRAYRDGRDPRIDGGWLPTGDVGSIDEDGRLTVLGRRGDVINTGGEKVWPDAVEAVLRAHPLVGEVAVAGRPDPEWGQAVVAWVVPANGEVPVLDELRDWTKQRLPAYAAPKRVVTVDALPRTTSGKVRRRDLRA